MLAPNPAWSNALRCEPPNVRIRRRRPSVQYEDGTLHVRSDVRANSDPRPFSHAKVTVRRVRPDSVQSCAEPQVSGRACDRECRPRSHGVRDVMTKTVTCDCRLPCRHIENGITNRRPDSRHLMADPLGSDFLLRDENAVKRYVEPHRRQHRCRQRRLVDRQAFSQIRRRSQPAIQCGFSLSTKPDTASLHFYRASGVATPFGRRLPSRGGKRRRRIASPCFLRGYSSSTNCTAPNHILNGTESCQARGLLTIDSDSTRRGGRLQGMPT